MKNIMENYTQWRLLDRCAWVRYVNNTNFKGWDKEKDKERWLSMTSEEKQYALRGKITNKEVLS